MPEFSLFNGKLSPSILAKWLEEKHNSPLPAKDQTEPPGTKKTEDVNFLEIYKGIYEFIHGVIVSPEDYGFKNTAWEHGDHLFRLLQPFFFPGIEKIEQLKLNADETLLGKRKKWNEDRTKVFDDKLAKYEKDLSDW